MNPRLFLLFVMASVSFQTKATAFAGVWRRDVSLQPNGSVIIHPREQITLKYEIRDGKIAILKAIPTVYPMEENTITLALDRTGGTITRFGTVTPFNDSLSITGRPAAQIALRCTYLTEGLRKPVTRSIPSTGHGFGRKLAWVEILDFRLVKP